MSYYFLFIRALCFLMLYCGSGQQNLLALAHNFNAKVSGYGLFVNVVFKGLNLSWFRKDLEKSKNLVQFPPLRKAIGV